ncbi:maternal effect protein oskar isoform X2 [Toxorhynchites rutilus septentrionalis]|uniref:maternal effect protein oskar isoform X2 n=1 Tax=Toxorhynchites rutilus septentrionalis TaxID=329112 RepID=UPI002479B72E|nr:maternal effect protein oskar isoform X2 [Toxorhynchites rutilus septentrionalis]
MVGLENCEVQNETTPFSGVDTEGLASILKSIIITRCKEGATIDEIIDDYKDHTGDELLSIFRDRDSIADYLRCIDGTWSSFNAPNGPYLWYCNTEKTRHLSEMIKKQKPTRFSNKGFNVMKHHPTIIPHANSSMVSESGTREKFFDDNMGFISKRNAWNRIQHRAAASHPYLPPQRRQGQQIKPMSQRRCHPNTVRLYVNHMIGDDFFLSLARWELGYSFDPGYSIQRSGLCISGLTIAEAADRVMKATFINDRVMVNIGVVDLLHGHDFVDMQQDLFQLMKNLENRGASVVLTTLSPLANSSHIPGVADRLQKFNNLIRRYHWQYIDLWKCFVNERNSTLYECFQPGPRHVSGSNQPHVLWNKLGRQRIIKFLKTDLATFM